MMMATELDGSPIKIDYSILFVVGDHYKYDGLHLLDGVADGERKGRLSSLMSCGYGCSAKILKK